MKSRHGHLFDGCGFSLCPPAMHLEPDLPSLEFFDCDVLVGPTLRSQQQGLDSEALSAELTRAGIARALVYSHGFGPCAWEAQNQTVTALSAGHSNLSPCFILPQYGSVLGDCMLSTIETLVAEGARCFRIDAEIGPASGPLTLDRFPKSGTVWEYLARHRLPVLVPGAHLPEANRRFAYDLDAVVALCRHHPDLPVVLLNPPYAIERLLAHALAATGNLYLSITRLGVFGQLEAFVRMFGPRRFLFGSGLPFNDPAIPSGVVRYANLAHDEKVLIASGNLDRLLSKHERA